MGERESIRINSRFLIWVTGLGILFIEMRNTDAGSGLRGRKEDITVSNTQQEIKIGAQKQGLNCIRNLGVVNPEMCNQYVSGPQLL